MLWRGGTLDVVVIDGFLGFVPEEVEGVVVGAPEEFEFVVYSVLLVVVYYELAVCYVLWHFLLCLLLYCKILF